MRVYLGRDHAIILGMTKEELMEMHLGTVRVCEKLQLELSAWETLARIWVPNAEQQYSALCNRPELVAHIHNLFAQVYEALKKQEVVDLEERLRDMSPKGPPV